MKFPCLFLIIAILVLPGCGGGGGQPGVESTNGFFFIQIADPQIGVQTGNGDLTPDLTILRQAIVHVNRLKPAFVIITGDMINQPLDANQIKAFKDLMSEVRPDVPVYYVTGNHDVGPATAGNVSSYVKAFGPDHYAYSHGGTEFVVVNTSLLLDTGASEALRTEQRTWFEGALGDARVKKPDHIFVFGHHSWFLRTRDEPDTYYNVPTAQRVGYLDLMKQYGVEYAICGHLHREASAKDDKLTIITTSSLTSPLGSDPQGLRIFKVYPDRVQHTFYSLGHVPTSIRM